MILPSKSVKGVEIIRRYERRGIPVLAVIHQPQGDPNSLLLRQGGNYFDVTILILIWNLSSISTSKKSQMRLVQDPILGVSKITQPPYFPHHRYFSNVGNGNQKPSSWLQIR